ncbi:MAG: glycosyltransferase family 9 protein [Acetobacteraceae bacterium]|nr:glycosyltransferase family 9 protein [Acetobacteraceae bacterium]
MTRVLVIRLGALGDVVMSFAAFAAIRAHHPGAEVTLLTTRPYAGLAEAAPWFDRVAIDPRPAWWDLAGLWRLRGKLRGFDMVYDLQTSGRSGWYFHLAGHPPWSGIARGCSHPQRGAAREAMHTFERQRDQLAASGIAAFPVPDLSFLTARPVPALPDRFALLVPGASAHRPGKRWPAAAYGELAGIIAARGIIPVVIGAADEGALAATICAACPQAQDLTGRTALLDVFAIAARAAFVVGNDTGPTHIAAAAGCRTIVLFSADSDPAMSAPRGPDGAWPTVLRVPVLADLSVARVAATLP